MMLDMSGIRPALNSGAVKYLLIVCAVVGTVTAKIPWVQPTATP